MRKKPNLEEVLKKITRFRWENYLKDYTGDYQRIQFLYWNLVYNDIVGQDNLEFLSTHIAKSYLGIFFWPHRCYQEILNRFDGLEFYQLERHQQLWNQWKDQILYQRADAIGDIAVLTHRTPPKSPYVYKQNAGDFWVDWKSFDHYYIQKTPAASAFLIDHLRSNNYWYTDPKSTKISLPYRLDDVLVKSLHRNGETIAKSMILYRAFSRIETDKDNFLSSDRGPTNVENKSYKHLQSKNMFLSNHLTTPTKAIRSVLKENQEYQNLSLSQMKHIIQTHFLNVDGRPFKDNSLSKALRRNKFTN